MFLFIIFNKYICEEQLVHQISILGNAISNLCDFLIEEAALKSYTGSQAL